MGAINDDSVTAKLEKALRDAVIPVDQQEQAAALA